jgi:hypothetical protein
MGITKVRKERLGLKHALSRLILWYMRGLAVGKSDDRNRIGRFDRSTLKQWGRKRVDMMLEIQKRAQLGHIRLRYVLLLTPSNRTVNSSLYHFSTRLDIYRIFFAQETARPFPKRATNYKCTTKELLLPTVPSLTAVMIAASPLALKLVGESHSDGGIAFIARLGL